VKRDPLIDEIRAVRHPISACFGRDTQALLGHYRAMEKQYGDRMLGKRGEPSHGEMENEGPAPVALIG